MEQLLDELYQLTRIEEERKLNTKEVTRYLEIVDILNRNGIEIPFGIVI